MLNVSLSIFFVFFWYAKKTFPFMKRFSHCRFLTVIQRIDQFTNIFFVLRFINLFKPSTFIISYMFFQNAKTAKHSFFTLIDIRCHFPINILDKSQYEKDVCELIDSLNNGEESAMRKTLRKTLRAVSEVKEFYISQSGDVYLKKI